MTGNTSQHQAPPSHEVLEQAAHWFTLLRSGRATDQDQRRWRSWLDAGEDHRLAWSYVENLSRRFDSFRQGELGRRAETALAGPRLDDTERALALLESTLPVKIRRPMPWWSVIEFRQPL